MASNKPCLLHLNNSQSQVILWLLEELEIDYDVKLFQRVENRAPAVLKETHPLGKSPQLITANGRVIAERTAISKYLIDTYDTTGKFKLNPTDTEHDAVWEEELLSFGGSTLSPALMLKMVLKFLASGSPFFIRPVMSAIGGMVNKAYLNAEIEAMLKYFDSKLENKQYCMNTANPTRADFCMLWYIDLGLIAGYNDLSIFPNIKAWHSRCKARDGWKRAMEKGNGYELDFKV